MENSEWKKIEGDYIVIVGEKPKGWDSSYQRKTKFMAILPGSKRKYRIYYTEMDIGKTYWIESKGIMYRISSFKVSDAENAARRNLNA